MALKLDDLIGKKKEVVQILDLSKATANNAEEFRKIMEKVPDFKTKPEKVKAEDVKVQDRRKRWNRRPKKIPYQFADPIPLEMRALKLEDLCSVPIQWNMLTTLRPKAKMDEEYFSRLVELGKLEIATSQKEKKVPISEFLKKMKSRTGVSETRFISCAECGEDFCQREVCHLLQYENFKRVAIPETIGKKDDEPAKGKRRGKSKARKSRSRGRSKTRTRSKSRNRSSSVERPKSKTRSKSRSKSRTRSKSAASSKSANKEPDEAKTGKAKTSKSKSKGKSKIRKGSNSTTRKPKKK